MPSNREFLIAEAFKRGYPSDREHFLIAEAFKQGYQRGVLDERRGGLCKRPVDALFEWSFTEGKEKELLDEAPVPTNFITFCTNPTVPIGEVHVTDRVGNILGRIINLREE